MLGREGGSPIRISVIIPTLNAEKYICELLRSLNQQTLRPYEVIVIDSASTDNTVLIASQMKANVIRIDRSQFDHGRTRNYAASKATGEVFVFLTQDAIPADETFLEKLVGPFVDEAVAAVCGRQVAYDDATVLEKMNREFNYPAISTTRSLADVDRYGIKTFFMSNVCAGYRASAFLEVRGFVEPIVSNEDMIMAATLIRKGYSIVYASDARVRHSHNYSLKQLFTRYFDVGGSLQLHSWILECAKPEGEGVRLVKWQLMLLRKPSKWRWIPRLLAESIVKYVGYRLGLAHHKLPSKLRKRCSMHPLFWDRLSTSSKSVEGMF